MQEDSCSKLEVAPLPEEIMKHMPILSLSSEGKLESEVQVKKKDKRMLRQASWLQSKHNNVV